MEKIEEGKLSDAAARVISLAIKKRVISKGREVRSAETLEEKMDLLSQQVSALAALTLVGISVGGNGLLSKTGIVSGLFMEEFEKELLDAPPKTEEDFLIYKTSTKDVEKDLTPFMKNYVNALSQQR
jgi:hypothetical protein